MGCTRCWGLATVAQNLPQETVAVLLADVEGSTDLATHRDEVAHDVLRARRELVRHRMEAHGGHEVKVKRLTNFPLTILPLAKRRPGSSRRSCATPRASPDQSERGVL